MQTKTLSCLAGASVFGALLFSLAPAIAQAAATVDQAGQTAGQAVDQAGATAGQTVEQLPNTIGQVGNTAGQLGNTATDLTTGLQPTLQPVGQGVGNALNNLTQPDNINSLLEFLSSVIPNHIEAHVNLDALRVEKLTVDIRGVDLRNLKVDLLVANSRNAGQVRPAMNTGARTGTTGSGVNTSVRYPPPAANTPRFPSGTNPSTGTPNRGAQPTR